MRYRPLLKLWHDFIGHHGCYVMWAWLSNEKTAFGTGFVVCDECGMMTPIGNRINRDLYERLTKQ